MHHPEREVPMSSTAAVDLLTPVLSAEEALGVLGSLDLTMVRRKIADPNEGKGWDEGQLDLAEREYRRFLALHLMYPEAEVVPCHLVDEFWHQHILDTHAYAKDCLEVFGFFLHHFPYFGMRGEQDAMDLMDAYDDTIDRYETAFGELPVGIWRLQESAKCGRTACKPQKCR
jgi:hypothetical protein